MKKLTSLVLLFSTLGMFSQTKFEKGYFIDNQNNKVECLIKNLRWLNNPKEIQYKLNENGDERSFSVENSKGFQVYNGPYYHRVSGEFPITTALTTDKGIEATPKLVDREVFVKEIITGKASLYEYYDENERNFVLFTTEDKQTPIILLYKQYIRVNSNDIKENNIYRRQLLEHLNCGTVEDIQKTAYTRKSLVSYILSYNKCVDPLHEGKEIDKASFKTKTKLGLIVFGGVANYGFDPSSIRDIDFENKVSPTVGLELEAILPFGNNKWSVFLSSQYASYKAKGKTTLNNVELEVGDIELSQIVNNFGGRHYMFFSNNLSVFMQFGATLDHNTTKNFNPNSEFRRSVYEIRSFNFGGFGGVGLSIDQKYYLNTTYFVGGSILRNDLDSPNNLKRFVVSVGVKL
ncbi:hypothetical protein [Flagellimonas nanhaiensis]|uniref:PorT family protein n=1 Tax=Flagellimonas nanhaiensis TaxID=2292706 RepID=A0A371JTR9_9FLAO|nr:hypothetical protein [Allomuricauda nanhaiensis]RDY61204.1 hypothetical protein DX873_03275 [Allomuricauda nanhaiensis]